MKEYKVVPLREYIDERGLSYEEFAHKVGCSIASVCLWVNQKSIPSPNYAIKIHKVTKGMVPLTSWGYCLDSKGRAVRLA